MLQALRASLWLGAPLDLIAGGHQLFVGVLSAAPAPSQPLLYPWSGPAALLVMGGGAILAGYDFERLRPMAGWFALAHLLAGTLGTLLAPNGVSWAVLTVGAVQLALWRAAGRS